MSIIQQHGSQIAIEFFNDGDSRQFQRILRDTRSKDPRRRITGYEAVGACLITLAKMLADTKRKGLVRFSGARIATPEEVAYAYQAYDPNLSKLGQQLVDTVAAVRSARPGLKASSRDTAEPKPVAPMQVQIVGMPGRSTVTKVEHDMAGNITGSVQVESDL